MPLYEYQCQECGEVSEHLQRSADPPFTICAACGGALKKLISAPAIQFKGSGFYITDYGKGNGGKREGSSTSESSGAGESGTKSKDSSKESKESKATKESKPASSEAKP